MFPSPPINPITKSARGWRAIRLALTTHEKPALITLIKALYDVAEVNRDLLQARLLANANDEGLYEKYRHKIEVQFFPARGIGKLKLGEARKAIREYRKATGNIVGTAELLMTFVENGMRFTQEFGDIDARFYNNIESALAELATLLRGEARDLYPQFAKRLAAVEQMSDGIGWGFSAFITEVVGNLVKDCGDSSQP